MEEAEPEDKPPKKRTNPVKAEKPEENVCQAQQKDQKDQEVGDSYFNFMSLSAETDSRKPAKDHVWDRNLLWGKSIAGTLIYDAQTCVLKLSLDKLDMVILPYKEFQCVFP